MAKKKNKGGNGGNNAENNNNNNNNGENKEENNNNNNNNNEGNKEENNNNNHNGGEKKEENNKNNNNGGEKNNNGGDKKEENNKGKNNATVLKVYMHCEGCANKVTKHLNSIKGVDTVKAESETGKVTVTGNVDPTKLRDNLAEKIKKKVELISPLPKKDNNKKENEPNKKSDEKKNEDKKESITTSVLKLVLHCQGCIDKIGKIVMKTKGVLEMKVDKEKDNVTVKGTMDVKKLVENLSQKLKRKVEVVQPKKDKEGGGGGEKDGNEGGGGGGKKKNKGGGDGNNNEAGGEVKIMEYMVQQPFGFGYGNVNVEGYNAAQVYQEMLNIHMQTQPPQMFSDENPNACIVM